MFKVVLLACILGLSVSAFAQDKREPKISSKQMATISDANTVVSDIEAQKKIDGSKVSTQAEYDPILFQAYIALVKEVMAAEKDGESIFTAEGIGQGYYNFGQARPMYEVVVKEYIVLLSNGLKSGYDTLKIAVAKGIDEFRQSHNFNAIGDGPLMDKYYDMLVNAFFPRSPKSLGDKHTQGVTVQAPATSEAKPSNR